MRSPVDVLQIKDFLRKEKVVVVEPTPSFAQTLLSFLKDAGVPQENLFHAKKYVEAVGLIKVHKPKILITECHLGAMNGMNLIQIQTEFHDEASKVAVLVTHDSASSTIAEAAEEHVDAYMLKPFSIGEFKDRFFDLIISKIRPTNYQQKIRDGKQYLRNRDFEKAAIEFSNALKHEDKPALAHYYIGQAMHMQHQLEPAMAEYKKGLEHNPLHFKCMIGEFDSLFDQKKYKESYELAKKIADNFPLSPKRLGNVFISLVFSQNLHDITKYFDLYQALDMRPPELVKIFSAALLTAGKFYLKENNVDKANECFEMGLVVTGPAVGYLDSIIRSLLKANAYLKASNFLPKFPAEEIGKKVYSQLSFLIDCQSPMTRGDVIERGKKLVAQGYGDPDTYRALIQIMVEQKKNTMAEDIASKAVKDFPDLRQELYGLIEGSPQA